MKPRYIIFEGCDGVGKTTLANLLVQEFNSANIKCILTKEPGTPHIKICQKLREILIGEDVHFLSLSACSALFSADCNIHLNHVVIPSLYNEVSVISDRSVLSDFAYRPSVIDMLRIDNIKTVLQLDPIIFYIDTPPKIVKERMTTRGELNKFEDLYVKNNIKQLQDNYIKHSLSKVNKFYTIYNSSKLAVAISEITSILEKLGIPL